MEVVYHRAGEGVLYQGDCRVIVPQLAHTSPPEEVDVAIVDPPYGDTKLDWDSRDLGWLEDLDKVVKPTGTIWLFGSMRMLMAQAAGIEALGWQLAQDLVWEKHNGSGFHADRFKRVHEHVVHLYRKAVRWKDVYKSPVTTPDAVARQVRRKKRPTHMGNVDQGHYVAEDGGPRLMRSVLQVRSCHGYADHPTQKPVGLLTPLLEYSCPPGGTVLDPMCGVASTLVAARSLGRGYVGIELDPHYCEVGARRLSQELPFFASETTAEACPGK